MLALDPNTQGTASASYLDPAPSHQALQTPAQQEGREGSALHQQEADGVKNCCLRSGSCCHLSTLQQWARAPKTKAKPQQRFRLRAGPEGLEQEQDEDKL